MPLSFKYMAFVTPLDECRIGWDGGEWTLKPFETALIPASVKGVFMGGRLTALCSTLPDREALKAQLGYRAENVAGLVQNQRILLP